MSLVTVVIPNWNGLTYLPECLSALYGQTFRDFEIIVVDNGSTDASVAWLREHAPSVRIIERADNGGFAVAVNAGILAASGEFVALLNNDAIADPRWLAELVRTLDGSSYDFAASLMVCDDSPETVDAAGDDFGIGSLMGRPIGHGRPVERYPAPVRVLGACAGAALYRRGMFDDVGLFDEDFFLIHEDSDLNLRALIAGKRCLYLPTAVVRHKRGATIKAQPAWSMQRYEIRNRAAVLAKDLPAVLLPWAVVTWPWRLFRSTFPLRPDNWRLIPGLIGSTGRRVRAEREGWRMGWAKRREVWDRQTVPTREVVRWLRRGTGPAS